MKKTTKRRIRIVITVFILVLAAGLIFGANYLTNFAIARKTGGGKSVAPASSVTADDSSIISANREKFKQQVESWQKENPSTLVSIESDDGLKLSSEIFTNANSNNWVIAIHGYNGGRHYMNNVAYQYYQHGYNILLPDLRANGDSEGKWIGMGYLDKKDIVNWIEYLIERYGDINIVLHGISMGGATVMMTSAEDLPANVKGLVEDCGYTSVWDIFEDELSYLYHLPAFPLLNLASGISKIKAGYSFKEASSLKAISKAKLPVLFIHGSEDTFVHTEMVHKVYDACNSTKEKLIVQGAGHGESYLRDPDLYFETTFNFLKKNCGM